MRRLGSALMPAVYGFAVQTAYDDGPRPWCVSQTSGKSDRSNRRQTVAGTSHCDDLERLVRRYRPPGRHHPGQSHRSALRPAASASPNILRRKDDSSASAPPRRPVPVQAAAKSSRRCLHTSRNPVLARAQFARFDPFHRMNTPKRTITPSLASIRRTRLAQLRLRVLPRGATTDVRRSSRSPVWPVMTSVRMRQATAGRLATGGLVSE